MKPSLLRALCTAPALGLLIGAWPMAASAGDSTQFESFGGTRPLAITWTAPANATRSDSATSAATANSAQTANSVPTATRATTAQTALALDPQATITGTQVNGTVASATNANFANTAVSAPGASCNLFPGTSLAQTVPDGFGGGGPSGQVLPDGTVIPNAGLSLITVCVDGNNIGFVASAGGG